MKGKLRVLIARLRKDAIAAPSKIFAEGRRRHRALAAHSDVASVFAALADEAKATYPARENLTRALLSEHRTSGNALWASMLLVAFYPMLSRLRARLVSHTVSDDELDQLVVTSLLTAMVEMPEHRDRVAMWLRQRTARKVFTYLRKERAEAPSDDSVVEQIAVVASPRRWSTDEKFKELAIVLQHAAEAGISQSGLDIVAATVLRRELLRNYVARLVPNDERARERTYQRLKRQRSRTLRRLKSFLRMSPALADISLRTGMSKVDGRSPP